jgi:sialate O-acetylesterase
VESEIEEDVAGFAAKSARSISWKPILQENQSVGNVLLNIVILVLAPCSNPATRSKNELKLLRRTCAGWTDTAILIVFKSSFMRHSILNVNRIPRPKKVPMPLRFHAKPQLAVVRLLAAVLLASVIMPVQAAGLKLAPYFGDHMVLQRDRKICVWGTGEPGAKVEADIASQEVATKVGPDGHWKVYFQPMSAGGPYTLTATSEHQILTLSDVLCGDVWLCSGQSNMQMPVKECVPREQQTALESHPKLRLCTVGKGWNAKPQFSADFQWRICTPDSARNFSAVAYFFADELLKDKALTQVPIGVIDSSYGGTTCEGWIPQPALAAFKPDELHKSIFGIKPAMLYNAMIAPLSGAVFKGVVWYQGESNSGHPDTYPRLLSTMISEWRRLFVEPNLPFYIVQLPDYASQWDGFYWPWLREAQAKVAQTTPHTTLVVGIDTTDGFNLHPKTKLEIGRRISLAVRHTVYHENIVASGPTFQSAKIEGSSIRVEFDTHGDGLSNSLPGNVRGFAVAGRDGIYHFSDARIEGDSVVVQCNEVPVPQTVRYAWTGVPDSTLVNEAGLPATPFRTDDFPCSNVEVQREPISHQVTTPAYTIVVSGEGMVTSLSVGNAQFVSNDPGMSGGSSIPGIFGNVDLPDIKEVGPKLLSCGDGDFTFLLNFEKSGMRWDFFNRGKNGVKFNLALSPQVTITQQKGGNAVTLRCKTSFITITGIDAILRDENKLQFEVKAASTKSATIKVGS